MFILYILIAIIIIYLILSFFVILNLLVKSILFLLDIIK